MTLATRSFAARSAILLTPWLAACAGAPPESPPAPAPIASAAPAAPPAPVAPALGSASASASTSAGHDDAARFGALRDRIVDEWLADRPSLGRTLGLHEHDGRVADYSAAALEAQIARQQKAREELAAFDPKSLSPDDALDLAILEKEIDDWLFHAVDLADWRHRPQFYGELFEVNPYIDRDYAPLPERARRLLAHEKAALAGVHHIRDNLALPMSKPVLETAAKIYAGYAEYLRGDVVKVLKGAGDAAFQADFAKTNELLAKEADGIAKLITKELLPKADDKSHVLGPERYQKLLLVQEGLKMPLAELGRMGEENLAANKKAYVELKKKTKFSRPPITSLLDAATKLMTSSRQFILDKHIVTIPAEDRAILKESPPYMRWNSAFLDASGPFDTAKLAFFYVTMPDRAWPKKEQEDYVMPLGILMSTTIHEVYPGHFLQSQWIRKAPTRVQKIVASYSFVEGWAHYIEQMMVDEGFGADDPQNHLGQLSDALLRNCRVVVSLGIHTEGMTLPAAEKRFMEDCFQDKATAHEQAVRGTFDPGYFAYTLGKLQILSLREEAKKLLGDEFTLQRFHDELLSHGSPSIPLIHDRVLADLAAAAK